MLANKDHTDFPGSLDRYIRAEEDVLRLQTTLEELALSPEQIGSSLLLELAVVYELTGDLSRAADHYHQAADILPPDSPELAVTNVNYARILYDLGDDQDALAVLQTIPQASQVAIDSLLLQSAIHRDNGQHKLAIDVLLTALEGPFNDARRPIVLLSLTTVYTEIDDKTSALLHKNDLLRIAPHSPEAAIARKDGSVDYFLSPNRLFQLLHSSPPVVPTVAPAHPDPPPTAIVEQGRDTSPESQVSRFRIQTGSFRDPENAQYMIKDLDSVGFHAIVEQTAIGNQAYQRVFLDGVYPAEEAAQLLLRLKDSGFEGYLVTQDE